MLSTRRESKYCIELKRNIGLYINYFQVYFLFVG